LRKRTGAAIVPPRKRGFRTLSHSNINTLLDNRRLYGWVYRRIGSRWNFGWVYRRNRRWVWRVSGRHGRVWPRRNRRRIHAGNRGRLGSRWHKWRVYRWNHRGFRRIHGRVNGCGGEGLNHETSPFFNHVTFIISLGTLQDAECSRVSQLAWITPRRTALYSNAQYTWRTVYGIRN
jgi:hypothetical protein